ncbi:uncharacterized protein LOC108670853 [Hyalella azteca]|uniref:Uncharacterized protein LOC108670853 n=1 Tax=Hyalella azteca TaxID=294128 RepID=A0A8B7NJL3_HYAAZ|nr:uncharacterized protein LOC108670853 [Hyalella azteca]
MFVPIVRFYCMYLSVLFAVRCQPQVDLDAPIDLRPPSPASKSTVVIVNNKKEARLPLFVPRAALGNSRDALDERERPNLVPSKYPDISHSESANRFNDNERFSHYSTDNFGTDQVHYPVRDEPRRRSDSLDSRDSNRRPDHFRPLTSSDFKSEKYQYSQKSNGKFELPPDRRLISTRYRESIIRDEAKNVQWQDDQRNARYGVRRGHKNGRKPPILIFEEVPVYVQVHPEEKNEKGKPPLDYYYEAPNRPTAPETYNIDRRPDRFSEKENSPPVQENDHSSVYSKDSIYTTDPIEHHSAKKEDHFYNDDDLRKRPSQNINTDESLNNEPPLQQQLPPEVVHNVVYETFPASGPSIVYDPQSHFSEHTGPLSTPDLSLQRRLQAAAAAEALAIGVLQQRAAAGLALNQRLREIAAIRGLQQAIAAAQFGRSGSVAGRSQLSDTHPLDSHSNDETSFKIDSGEAREIPEKIFSSDFSDTISNQIKKHGQISEKDASSSPQEADFATRLHFVRSFLSQSKPEFDSSKYTSLTGLANDASTSQSNFGDDTKFAEFLLALPDEKFRGLMNMSKQQFLETIMTNGADRPDTVFSGVFSTPPPLDRSVSDQFNFKSSTTSPLNFSPLPVSTESSISPTSHSAFISGVSSSPSLFTIPVGGQENHKSSKFSSHDSLTSSPVGDLTNSGSSDLKGPVSTIYRHQTSSIKPAPHGRSPSPESEKIGPVVNHHGTAQSDISPLTDASVSSYSSPQPPYPQSHYGSFRPNIPNFSHFEPKFDSSEIEKASFASFLNNLQKHNSNDKKESVTASPFVIPTELSPPDRDSFDFSPHFFSEFPSVNSERKFQSPTSKPSLSGANQHPFTLNPQIVNSVTRDFKHEQPFYTTISPVFHSTSSNPRTMENPLSSNKNDDPRPSFTDVENLTLDNVIRNVVGRPLIQGLGALEPRFPFDRLQEPEVQHASLVNSFNTQPGTDHNDDNHTLTPLEKRKGNATALETIVEVSSERDAVHITPHDIQYQEIPSVVSDRRETQCTSSHTTSNTRKYRPSELVGDAEANSDIFRDSNNTLRQTPVPQNSEPDPFNGRASPQPQRVDVSGSLPIGLNVAGGNISAVGQELAMATSVEELIRRLPAHLRKAPPPEAEQVAAKFKAEVNEMWTALAGVLLPTVSVQEAAMQLPTLDPSMECEAEERNVTLGWSRDVLGNWLAVLQTDERQQILTVKTCRSVYLEDLQLRAINGHL